MCSGSGERGKWTSGEIFDEINSLVDRLTSEDLTAVPSAAMADDQLTLQRIVSRVQAEFLRRLRRFDSGQGYSNTLALSAKAWLRWKCNLTPEAASDQVEVARELDSLPQTTKAFADGDISYRHVALIAHTAAELGDKMAAEAEVEWASSIPAETARRLACDCTITPILCGAESHQVEVGSSSRVIPPAMKRALIARDKHCRFPGCDMPPAWTDGHHIKHWANGGPHALWNLLLLCRRHHRYFHEGGWKLQQAEGGLQAIPP